MRHTRQRTKPLLAWYLVNARHLPWRCTSDPYAIWVSEIMLQQTQVTTVIPRYHVWLQQFPTIDALAKADGEVVLKAWEGLGYYRRVKMLHDAAKIIVEKHGGEFPVEFPDILALPGIGRSTAGAISSFCYNAYTPVLDGNVKRVLKRWNGSINQSEKNLWAWAQQSIDISGQPAAWNQAMMELGATCCKPKRPDCACCPVSGPCISAYRAEPSTRKDRTKSVPRVHWLVHLHSCPEKGIWLTQRSTRGIWAGLWSPPISEMPAPPEQKPKHIHQLTHRHLYLYVEEATKEPAGNGRWFADISQAAMPTGIRRLLSKQGIS